MPLEHREINFCNREVIAAILELNKEARILKLGTRNGDNADMARIELV